MQCPACGAEVVKEAVFCQKCGERIDATGEDREAGTPSSAALCSSQSDPSPAAGFARQNGPEQREEQLWRGGYSWKAMLSGWIVSGLVSLLLLAAGIGWAKNGTWWLVVVGLMALPWLYHLAVLVYRRMSVRYTLTTQRFMHESGILRRVNDRIEVLDMDDITFEQGLLDRLVGVGTIRIVSSDRSSPDLRLRGIENVKPVSELFDNARRVERRRRSLHIEQI